MAAWHIGVLTDAGVHATGLLDDAQELSVSSSFGNPSGPVTMGRIGGARFTFLARAGAVHALLPSEVNHRANIDALKRCGVTDVLAISAVLALGGERAEGDWVVADQIIDCTKGRESTFFGGGLAAHVDLADPVCARLSHYVAESWRGGGLPVQRGACLVALEGPRGPTAAEAAIYRQWGGDIMGMAAMPEAALAREAELPYALLGQVVAGFEEQRAQRPELFRNLATMLPAEREASPIDRALDNAITTAPANWDRRAAMRLDAVAGRVLKQGRPDWF